MAKVKQEKEMYQFDLIDARMVGVNFQIKPVDDNPDNISIDTRFTVDHKLIDEGVNLQVAITINISGDHAPFTLDATYGGIFRFKTPITDKKQIEYVAEINCASILFPFLREIIADITRRAGFAPLLLPPLNLMDIYSKNHPEN